MSSERFCSPEGAPPDGLLDYIIDDSVRQGTVAAGADPVAKPLHASRSKVKVPRQTKDGLRGAAAFYGGSTSQGEIWFNSESA